MIELAHSLTAKAQSLINWGPVNGVTSIALIVACVGIVLNKYPLTRGGKFIGGVAIFALIKFFLQASFFSKAATLYLLSLSVISHSTHAQGWYYRILGLGLPAVALLNHEMFQTTGYLGFLETLSGSFGEHGWAANVVANLVLLYLLVVPSAIHITRVSSLLVGLEGSEDPASVNGIIEARLNKFIVYAKQHAAAGTEGFTKKGNMDEDNKGVEGAKAVTDALVRNGISYGDIDLVTNSDKADEATFTAGCDLVLERLKAGLLLKKGKKLDPAPEGCDIVKCRAAFLAEELLAPELRTSPKVIALIPYLPAIIYLKAFVCAKVASKGSRLVFSEIAFVVAALVAYMSGSTKATIVFFAILSALAFFGWDTVHSFLGPLLPSDEESEATANPGATLPGDASQQGDDTNAHGELNKEPTSQNSPAGSDSPASNTDGGAKQGDSSSGMMVSCTIALGASLVALLL